MSDTGSSDRLRRAMQGKTQAWLAARVGVATSSVNGYLKDKMPPADVCLRICDVLAIDMRWLLTGEVKAVDSGERVVQVGIVNAPEHALTFPESLVSSFEVPVDSLCSLVVRGSLMSPTVPENAEVLATRSVGEIVDGSVYILKLGERYAVRRLALDAAGGVHAICDNPQASARMPDAVQYQDVVAAVLWVSYRLAAPAGR